MSIIDLISEDLRIPKLALISLSNNTKIHYRTFIVNGREIEAPDNQLKLVQTWISDYLRMFTPALPDYVTAYEPGSSINANALIHKDKEHILSLDIRHFFHSWRIKEVSAYFEEMRYFDFLVGEESVITKSDAEFLGKLSTYHGRLTMGSPSSPALANRLMLPIDQEICERLCGNYSYSRYSDDITISSNNRICVSDLLQLISEPLRIRGLELNKKKTHCMGKGDNRKITGIYITPEGELSLGKVRRAHIKSLVYKYAISDKPDGMEAKKILGYLHFCQQIEPDFVFKLILKYSNYGRASKEYGGLMGMLERDSKMQDKRFRTME